MKKKIKKPAASPALTRFAKLVRQTIKKDGRSAAAIAVKSGLSRSQLSHYLNGRRQLQADNLEKLAKVLKLDLVPVQPAAKAA